MGPFDIMRWPEEGRQRAARWAVLAVMAALLAYLVGRAVRVDGLGAYAIYDDTMRVVQLRDWMQGQGWFDTTQYRLGLDGGTAIHWSRLIDLPIAMLAWALGLFMEDEAALNWAVTLWPPLTGLGVVAATAWAGRALQGAWGAVIGAVIGAKYVVFSSLFFAGQVDHHNVQQLCILVAVLALVIGDRSRRKGAVAGLAVALSLAVGTEALLFCAMICAIVALDWALSQDRSGMAGAFGLGLAGGVSVAFLATIAPSNWGAPLCDQLSSVFVLASLCGGLGLYGLDRFLPDDRLKRMGGLVLLGVICAGVMLLFAPQCLANPLDDLPQPVQDYWLANITEAVPIYQNDGQLALRLWIVLPLPLLAFAVLATHAWQRRLTRGEGLLLILMIGGLAFTIYQVRFSAFLWTFSTIAILFGLVRWRGGTERYSTGVLVLTLALMLSPSMLATPGMILMQQQQAPEDAMPMDGASSEQAFACEHKQLAAVMKSMPTGRILAPYNSAPTLLLETGHSVVSGSYHRNVEGLSAHIAIATAAPDDALRRLREAEVDYVVYCPAESAIFVAEDRDTLYARLSRLEPVAGLMLIHDGASDIYAVER